MQKIVSAHQPNFLPYLGFFDKMINSDIFIIRDDVQFVQRDFHHRNRIKVYDNNSAEPKYKWLTVPVEKRLTSFNDVRIKNEVKIKNIPWSDYMVRELESNYHKSEFFNDYFPKIKNILNKKHEFLIDLNVELIYCLADSFEINTNIIFASSLISSSSFVKRNPSQDLIELVRIADSDAYLSGRGGHNYLDLDLFGKENIHVIFQEFNHPTYIQQSNGFIKNISAIDYLFNSGNLLKFH